MPYLHLHACLVIFNVKKFRRGGTLLGSHDRVDGQVCRPRAREGAARAVKMGFIRSEIYAGDLETLKMKASPS